MPRPASLPEWATVGAAVVEPTTPQKQLGWTTAKPPHQWFNWLFKTIYDWIVYLLDEGPDRLRSVANVAALKAIATQADGDHVYMRSKGVYEFQSASALTADDDLVVAPTVGSGRWILTLADIGRTKTAKRADFTGAGATAWVCPAGVYTVYVTGCGAGGGGAAGATAGREGGGGGAYCRRFPLPVTPGTSYTITRGAGGTAGAGAGGNGGDSTITAAGKPGLWLLGGRGGATSASIYAGDYQAPGDSLGYNWNWPEFGALYRSHVGVGGRDSELAAGGQRTINASNVTTPGYGGGGGTGYNASDGYGGGGSASLGCGGDAPTTTATTNGLPGADGAFFLEWEE